MEAIDVCVVSSCIGLASWLVAFTAFCSVYQIGSLSAALAGGVMSVMQVRSCCFVCMTDTIQINQTTVCDAVSYVSQSDMVYQQYRVYLYAANCVL